MSDGDGTDLADVDGTGAAGGAEAEWAPLAARLEATLLAQSTLWLTATLLGSWLVARASPMFSGFER